MKQTVLGLFGILGIVTACGMMIQDCNRPAMLDQAGGGEIVDDDIDTLEPLSLAPPPAALSPVQDRRVVSAAEDSSSTAATERALDPGRELLLNIAGEITDGWMPTEQAFLEHVDLRVGNVAGLGLGYVRDLLGENEILAWPTYYNALQVDGDLGSALDLPTDEDARRLWTMPKTEALFTTALEHWHVAAELEEAAYLMRNRDSVFDQAIELSKRAQYAGDHAWMTIFHQRSTYAHWAFLMRLAERLNE